MGKIILVYCFMVGFVFSGCAVNDREPAPICPGFESVEQALSALKAASQNMTSLRAAGQCRVDYVDEEGQPKTESFPVKLWMDPPAEMYLQGNIFLVPGGIILGSNNDEFWLLIKPKEISSYFWGSWTNAGSVGNLIINPKAVTEAIGVPALSNTQGWILSKQGSFDVLTERDSLGRTARKIYIDSCDFRIRKIEYYDTQQQLTIVTELDDYKRLSESFFVPANIKISEYSAIQAGNSVEISFDSDSISSATFRQKTRDWMFRRPSGERFDNGFEIVSDKIVKRW